MFAVPQTHQDVDRLAIVQFCAQYESLHRRVVHLNEITIKFGSSVTRQEAENQHFATTKLDADIGRAPKVFCFFVEGDANYLVMERIYGRPPETPDDTKTILQLIAHLHTFTSEVPGPVGGGQCNSLLWPDDEVFTPASAHELELLIQSRCLETDFNMKDSPLVFNHGDIRLGNILFGNQGIYLIDWEFGGFYPRSAEIAALSLTKGPTHEDHAFRQRLKAQILQEHGVSELEISQADSFLEFEFNCIRYNWRPRIPGSRRKKLRRPDPKPKGIRVQEIEAGVGEPSQLPQEPVWGWMPTIRLPFRIEADGSIVDRDTRVQETDKHIGEPSQFPVDWTWKGLRPENFNLQIEADDSTVEQRDFPGNSSHNAAF